MVMSVSLDVSATNFPLINVISPFATINATNWSVSIASLFYNAMPFNIVYAQIYGSTNQVKHTFQLSRLRRESYIFTSNLTLSYLKHKFSCLGQQKRSFDTQNIYLQLQLILQGADSYSCGETKLIPQSYIFL